METKKWWFSLAVNNPWPTVSVRCVALRAIASLSRTIRAQLESLSSEVEEPSTVEEALKQARKSAEAAVQCVAAAGTRCGFSA
jgi:hypothetical protein